MAYDRDFILELLDEGLLSSKFSADYFHYNESLIGKENLKLYHSEGCSVNQSQLAAWQWLIGRGDLQDGHWKPFMCMARRGVICNLTQGSDGLLHGSLHHAIILFNCLFLLVSLVSLAIWSRCKAYGSSRKEADDQLQFLRSFSALGTLGCFLNMVYYILRLIDSIRVFSTFHAILTAFLICMSRMVLMTCHSVVYTWNLLAASYLVEHAIPKQARVFTNKRRVQLSLSIGIALALPVGVFEVLIFGYLLCKSGDGTMHLITMEYIRLPYESLHITLSIFKSVEVTLCLVTIVLLIISACRRNCKWHQLSIASAVTDNTVAYSRQLDDEDDDHNDEANDSNTPETASGEPQVVINLPPSVTNQTLTDEFRLLIIWQVTVLTLLASLEVTLRILLESLYYREFLIHAIFALFFTKLALYQIPTPFVSRTFRAGFDSVYCELKSGLTRLQSKICHY